MPQSIWTPDGMLDLSGVTKKRDKVELRPGLMRWLSQFEDFAQHFDLGLHCSRCHADLVGKNGNNDRVFSVACACREFVGGNADYVERKATMYDA